MDDLLVLTALYIVFLAISFVIYKAILKTSSIWAIIISMIYLIGIYCYYWLLLKINYILIDKNIYIDFGHAYLGLVLFMFFCYINGTIFLAVAAYRRGKVT